MCPLGGAPLRVASYSLKLLHIASTAQLEVQCPPGIVPDLPCTLDSQPTPLQSSLHEALRTLAGGLEGGYRAGVVTVFGWTIGEGTTGICEAGGVLSK